MLAPPPPPPFLSLIHLQSSKKRDNTCIIHIDYCFGHILLESYRKPDSSDVPRLMN